jgi:hypothetical protein
MNCRVEADINYSEDDELAVCSSCGSTFEVNAYQVKMLQATGSIIKKHRRQGFIHACMNCSTDREVVLKDDKPVCKVCGATINLPPAMLNALKVRKDLPGEVQEPTSDRPKIHTGRKKPRKTTRRSKK